MSTDRHWTGRYHSGAVYILLILALLCVPIPLGSNRPYAWFTFEAYVYGILAFWALGALIHRNRRSLSVSVSRILMVLVTWLALVYLQTVPLPGVVLETLNPLVFSLQRELALISVDASNTLSIDPANTYNELLKYGAYVTVFGLLLATTTNRVRLLWISAAVILAGVLEAAFGIYSHMTGLVLFPERESGAELRAGTFVNRNHFSNMLTMVLGFVFGFLTSVVNAQDPADRLKPSRYPDSSFAMLLLLVGIVFVILSAIFVSGSRAPLVFYTLSFGIMLIVSFGVHRSRRTGEFLLAPIILTGVIVAVVFAGFDYSVIRLIHSDFSADERLIQNATGLKVLSAVWTAGVGAGNYRWIFPMFRDENLRFVTYDYAHNDYLQAAIEQGVFVSGVLGLGIFLILRELFRGYKHRRNPLFRGVIFGCLMSVVFMLLHALVEFNFRIPANAVYFFAIAAIGIAACRIDRGEVRPGSVRRTKARA